MNINRSGGVEVNILVHCTVLPMQFYKQKIISDEVWRNIAQSSINLMFWQNTKTSRILIGAIFHQNWSRLLLEITAKVRVEAVQVSGAIVVVVCIVRPLVHKDLVLVLTPTLNDHIVLT